MAMARVILQKDCIRIDGLHSPDTIRGQPETLLRPPLPDFHSAPHDCCHYCCRGSNTTIVEDALKAGSGETLRTCPDAWPTLMFGKFPRNEAHITAQSQAFA